MFKVGDKVVCVDAEGTTALAQGNVYTVTCLTFGGLGVGLAETRPANPYAPGFWSDRFRKIQRRDLNEWLSTAVKHTDHIDKRTKVPA